MKQHINILQGLRLIAALLVALSASITLSAQNDGFRSRISLGADWKIVKRLHLNAEYELRTQDSFSGVERHQAGIGMEYKLCPYLKTGLEYIYIGHYDSAGDLKPRHRLSLNLTGIYDAGDWRFSLKERLQLTHRAYSLNRFQTVPNALQLKSRFTVKYKGFDKVEPFAYFELRNIFNAPECTASYNTATGSYSSYEFAGYGHAYVNRLRWAAGFDWKLSNRHCITFTGMYSNCRDYEIDTNKGGTKLKSIGWEKSGYFTLGVGYKYSF